MTMPTTTTSRSTTLNSTSEEDADDMVAGDLGAGLGKKPGGLVFEEKEASPLQTPATAVAAGHCKGVGPHDPARALSGGGGGGGHAVNGCVGTRADRLADCELALEVLRHELEHSHEEAEALRRQLEQAHELLEEKDAAIQTLQSKAVFGIATSHCVEKVQRIEESKKSLEKEVNELRWEVESNRERLSSVEKLWLERYDRLCCENEALMASLELRAEEARNLSADNMGLKRQRDELQASLSVRDKRTLLGSCAGLGQRPGGRSEVTPLELAVLGACRCGGTAVPALATGEPCACAWATAAARRKIVELKSQLEELRRREEESVAVGDAYRIAFEQQLCRAATFAARMAPRQRPPSAAGRPLRHNHPAVPAHDGASVGAAATTAWPAGGDAGGEGHPGASVSARLVGRIARRLAPAVKTATATMAERNGDAAAAPDPVELLAEMLSDKEEALAHQRRVSLILARRTTHLEQQLRELTGEEDAGAAATAADGGGGGTGDGTGDGDGGAPAAVAGGPSAETDRSPAGFKRHGERSAPAEERGWARPDGWVVAPEAAADDVAGGGAGGE